jgi:multiple sugar transport system substrate-binding protein
MQPRASKENEMLGLPVTQATRQATATPFTAGTFTRWKGTPRAGGTRRRALQAAVTSAAAGGVVALAACGQAPAATEQASTGGSAKGSALFWQWGAGYVDGFQALVNEYNDKKTGVTINFDPGVVSAGSVNYWDKLTAAIAGGVAPDLFLMNTNARTWASQGLMRPLDDLIKKDKTASEQNQSTNKAFQLWYDLNGKQMGWPWDYSTIVTIYNVGHLKDQGLKLPADLGDKWDWATYREYAQKLNKPGVRWGTYTDPGYETGWLNFVRANGGDYFTDDRKKCVLGSPQVIEAMEFVVGIVVKDRYQPNRLEATTNIGKVPMFVNGLISMGTFGDWNMTDITKQGSSNLEWDVAPVPFKNGKTGNSANLRSVVVNAQSKNVDQAFDFMKFLVTKPVQDRIPKLFGEVPARLDSANDVYANPEKGGPPKGRASLKPAILATKALPAADKTAPADFHALSTALINDAWDGKIAVKDAMTQAQEQVNALLQKNGG